MSLFKLKEYWSVKSGGGVEHFSPHSVCIGNIDNSSDGYGLSFSYLESIVYLFSIITDKIAAGSLSGILRIYNPHKPGSSEQDKENSLDFRPSDLILEVQLKEPILQIDFGAFVRYAHIELHFFGNHKLHIDHSQ